MGKYDSLRQTVSGSDTSSIDTSSSSKYDDLKMTMGLIEDTRPKTPKLDRADLLMTDRVNVDNMLKELNRPQITAYKPGYSEEDILSGKVDNPQLKKEILAYKNEPAGTPRSIADNMIIGFGDKMSFGLLPKLMGEETMADDASKTVAGKIGGFAGDALPVGAAYKGANALVKGGGLLKNAARGAIAGGAYSATKQGLDMGLDTQRNGEQTWSERGKDFALDTAMFAGGDTVVGLAGKFGPKIGQAFQSWRSGRNPQIAQQADEMLSLPPGRGEQRLNTAMDRSNLLPNESPIAGTGRIADPLALPEPNILPPTRARIEIRPNLYTHKLENLFETANQQKFTPGRELEELDSLWSRMAGPNDPALNDLIDMAYPKQVPRVNAGALTRARELQQSREAAGVPNIARTMDDRYRPEINQAAAPRQRFEVQRNVESSPTKTQREHILQERTAPETDDLIQVKEPRMRDKVVTLLDDAEKAARARIAARRGRLNSLPIDEWADHAVILAAQIGKGGIKLVDATEYLVREFGEDIRPHAKTILNKARGVAQEAERRASKEAQEARAFNESTIGDASSFSGKVSRDVNKNRTPFSQRMEKVSSQFVDDQAPLEGLEKRVRGKLPSAENSLYKSARLFRGVPEKANQIVKDRLAPIVNGIEKNGYSSSQLGDYALAVHAKDVNARDIKSGFTNKEINEVISQLGTPEMEAARKELIKVSNDMLQELVDNGVISETLMKTLKERYPNYMPLFRAFDDEAVNFADGLSKSLANVTAPIKGLKGSERKVVDPLENMVKNIFQSTNAAERNKVAQQLAKLADEDVDSKFIRRLDDYEDVGRKNVVSVLQNGEKVRYEVEPEVYKALLNLDKESSNMLIKVLQKPASLLRAGATLTPEFSLRNPLRDVVQAFVTSNSGFNPLIDFPVGLIQSISKGGLYKQWVKELGAYGNIISNDRQVHKEALERVLKEPVSKKFVNVVTGKSLIKVLRAISDTTESATKVGEFRAALRKGVTPQEAAYRSRDIMDFGRAGSAIRETNKVVAFLNANIQGKSKLLRAFKENPAGFSARAFSAITAPTIGVFLMQKYYANDAQKQTIDESPNWLKDTFWLVPVPGTDQVARIPKPFDLNVLFSNLPERALNYTYNNDKEAMDNFAKKSIADSALPGMISGLIPFIEGMANYSFFREGRIIPQAEDGRNFTDQYDINTTETAKLLAKGANAITGGEGSLKNFSSPRIMDNTVKGLTAGLGTYATSAIDTMLDKFGVTDNPVRPAKGPSQQPLAKAFLVNPTQSGKSTEKLYDLKDKLTREKGSAKFKDLEFPDDKRLKGITKQTDAMSKVTKEIRTIENSRDLTPQAKREQIDVFLRKKNDIAIQGYKTYK